MNKSQSKYFNTACFMDEALLCLLEVKDFEYITIKEICKKAGVNRSTFYLHYENINDLLVETIESLNKKFKESFNNKLDQININETVKENLIFLTPDYLIPYLTFVKENKRAFKTIHQHPNIFEVQKVFDNMCKSFFNPILEKFNTPREKASYIFEFFTKGTLAVIMKWVERDCKDSVDFITNTIVDCARIGQYQGRE
ncbi:MAG: TetR/AcrR family transcriptional regulator [Clostridia bacterium]|nr:TetR/AcrR family transcriptional regulator [Clostridia bacterium]